jgi:RHS repeat-associated protein
VLSDVQGSSRAVMNNASYGSSTVLARHDYLPFGEEIWAGTGLRSSAQGYGASDPNRRKYGLTERDDTTGLDHTWWRKYENTSGRWISPDPYNGSITVANPQSLNRYAYVGNDPVNSVDPTGLYWMTACEWWALFDVTDPKNPIQIGDPYLRCSSYWVPESSPVGGGDAGGGPTGGGPQRFQHPQKKPSPPQPKPPMEKSQAQKQKEYDECFHREMAPTVRQLEQLMNRNLRNTALAGAGSGSVVSLVRFAAGGIGISIGVLGSLFEWRDQILDFGRDKLEPAQAAAKQKCKKEAGL